ncbi:Calcium-transporting ATPase lmo0841 [Chlamydia trachomatis]|nr:Calcium-transporting ATPase lmo0841 [Chlamydia trachomatis]CRH46707.1 Calcium-transporting ATPase lmo0841 [Chlamydia trachomatis]CRH55489.1 Calcium-transporting ATPase lmo0841 [Chlamydia trachomatis]CRH56913.1 Calcium-transporting ATPase lmo0841 [Chlamydia trachomatis]
MIDPPREEAKAAISICRQAGIKPVMITGDNINTAIAIAKSLNIYNDGDLAISGLELEKISDDELTNNIDKYSVYARVKPEDKLRIVNA